MASLRDRLSENLAGIRLRMADACARSGRPTDAARLIAVTKSGSIEAVQQLVDLGMTELGESRPQQLLDRAAVLRGDVRWHLIGHLQRNKVRRIIPAIACIHSIDSLRLLQALESTASKLGVKLRGLLEVNVSGEEAKDGFAAGELLANIDALACVQHVQIEGLMTMAPYSEEPETARPVFAALRTFRDQLAARVPSLTLAELSMGMSGDFEVAIEEGATLVRVGSSLFEGLPE
jgi:pyridoxal phosphate enzyme (YggS family)